jgi:hypothetical protein
MKILKEVTLSLESDMGRAANEVVGAINDSLAVALASMLKNELKLTDDQIRKVVAVASTTVESIAYNGVNQYVSVANKHISASRGTIDVDTTVKKTGLFGR